MSNESEEFTDEVEVSVLLPIYGSAPYIRETIESILNQDFKFFELIIVLDRAEKWVINYIERIPLIWEKTKILKSFKPGITSALNLGLENSSGKYIARIDSDDIMHTNRISIQKNYLDNNSQVNCLGTQVLKINQNGEPLGQTKFPTLYGDVARILTYRNCLAHPSVMFRKQAVIDLGGYSEDFNGCEDYELWLRISASGQVENLSQILTSYRTWP
jgi:glycosyltransferase involved in cell wall biosynthesis